MTTAIEAAVLPLKQKAIDAAEQYARQIVENVRKDLEDHNWDINAAAPYPMRASWGREYEIAKSKYNRYHALTTQDPAHRPTYRMGEPSYVIIDDKRIDSFVEQYKLMAAAQYEAFVAKLVAKAGEHTAATLETPSGVWDYSYVNVTTLDGTVDRWKTQCIGKYSKNGKFFHQWPTRKLVKGSKR